jgi:hypothetical protein
MMFCFSLPASVVGEFINSLLLLYVDVSVHTIIFSLHINESNYESNYESDATIRPSIFITFLLLMFMVPKHEKTHQPAKKYMYYSSREAS